MSDLIKIEYPMVSIVTINYNGAEVTCELLASLEKISYPNIEVIVVDNASKENPDRIKERYPWVTLLKNPVNVGFAGGNNAGFKIARGKYFLMLNNDTEVPKDFLQPLVKKMERDHRVGAVSPKLIFHHSPGVIQYAGSSSINPYTGRGFFVGHKEKDNGQYNYSIETCHAHVAAMMISKKVIEKIGMMAELYFLYYEEMDFCERIKEAGYSIWYIGESEVYHKESLSVGKENKLKTYYMTRNRLVYMRRNVAGISLLLSMLFFIFLSIPKNTMVHILSGRLDLLIAFYQGVIWNLFNHDIYKNSEL